MDEARTLDVGAELRDAHSTLNSALGRLAAFAAIAERLGKVPKDIDLPAANIVMRYGSAPAKDDEAPGEPEEVRDNFAAYCARFAAIGMVTACEEFLQRVLFIANLGRIAAGSGGGLTGAEFNETKEQTRKEVRNTSVDMLPMRILRVIEQHADPPDGIEWFRGVYGMRKCLLHRGGIVGTDDVGDGEALAATWRTPVIKIGGRAVTQLPVRADKGESLSVGFEDTVRNWRVGDAVTLTAEECQSIALTLGLFCGQVSDLCGKGVHDMVKGSNKP